MKNIKYRIPVKCTKCGQKAFWYAEICDDAIADHKNHYSGQLCGVPNGGDCDCPKYGTGMGWERAGENQLCLPYQDCDGTDIYEGDIVETLPVCSIEKEQITIDSFVEDAYHIGNLPQNEIKLIGSIWMGPTDTQSDAEN